VTTTKDQTVTAGHSVEVDPVRWQELLDELLGRVAGRFARVDLRQRARAFVRGLLSDLPRKNCWTIAEYAGDPNPDGMQHLLARAVWDQDAVRDDVRAYIVEHLGDPEAVLVVDETGDLKKGTTTVGVKRQYTGTAGRIENAQVAVYLVYATAAGHAVIDRELYLPRSWTDDPRRLQAVGVPDQVGFATKPALATRMITRALTSRSRRRGLLVTRSTAPTPGCGPSWRRARSAMCWRSPATTACPSVAPPSVPTPSSGMSRRGRGSRCRAARAPRATATTTGRSSASTMARLLLDGQAGKHWLMIRRHQRTGELAFYRCYTPRPVPLAVLVGVAGRRWTIEERFQTSKGLVGLDHHQVRRWCSWYRWVTLAMLAPAFLVVAAVTQRTRHPAPLGLVGLTCNEVQHLVAALLARPVGDLDHRLRWSVWRRHQARARSCHYRRQAAWQP
jgi:SRSO17 transposase